MSIQNNAVIIGGDQNGNVDGKKDGSKIIQGGDGKDKRKNNAHSILTPVSQYTLSFTSTAV